MENNQNQQSKANQPVPKVDLTNMQIGYIHVDSYDKASLWNCTCVCGKKIKVKTFNLTESLRKGKMRACEECSADLRRDDITGQQINDWKILNYEGKGFYRCQCKCGKIYSILGKTIKSGASKSCRQCGCDKMISTRIERYGDIATNVKSERSLEQVQACASADGMRNFILRNFMYKPKALEVSRLIGISECMTLRKIHKFSLEDYVEIDSGSLLENDIFDYIVSIYSGEIIERDRKILKNGELDVYIPEKQLAIEVNGNYWHSAALKEKSYHQNKTVRCIQNNVHLVHIFEYEWDNPVQQQKIKNYLELILNYNITKIGARDTIVKEISSDEAYKFEDMYHMQGKASSAINIGCLYNGQLIGVMTFGTPRFSNGYEYEVIRSCWKDHVIVMGGEEKMFQYFLNMYKPHSILTYVDLSKFTGNSYLRLGFKAVNGDFLTQPNYIWLNPGTQQVLPRYQTQKHKLIKNGIGTEDQTEDDIMSAANYLKIYDSGNLKLEWIAENKDQQ
jgi:hypothetical protein